MNDRRRRQVVEVFQYKVLIRIFCYGLIYQLTICNFLVCWRLLEGPGMSFLDRYRQVIQDFYPMIFCFLALVPIFAWDAVRHYHHVAGPIYRFRKTMQQVVANNPMRHIKLRKGDQLVELQDDFNRMLDTLAKRGAIAMEPVGAAPASGQPSRIALTEAH